MDLKGYLIEQAAVCDNILYGYFYNFKDENTKLFDAINYSVRGGGKRLRMIVMIEAAKLFGGDTSDAALFASALEMIHTYSLIHDDLPAMDNSDMRRGKPSCHKQYNECLAILAGDGLFHYAFEIMTKKALKHRGEIKYLEAMNVIAKKSGLTGMIYGQALDTENPKATDTLKAIIDERKTAAMFEAAVLAGAILGGAEEKSHADIELFGNHFGLAYQIIDDIADGDAPSEKLTAAKEHLAAAKKLINEYDKHGFFAALCDYCVAGE